MQTSIIIHIYGLSLHVYVLFSHSLKQNPFISDSIA